MLAADAIAAESRTTWDEALETWRPTRSAMLLRAYSDALNRRLLEQWLPRQENLRMLKTDLFDEAVGEGLYPLLRDRAAEVRGVDVSAAVVAAASERYPALVATAEDVRSLPFADGAFDVVVSNSTLDHFASLDELTVSFGELRRVLAPNGLLVVTLDNAANPLVALRNRLPKGFLSRTGLVPYPVGATCGPKELQALLGTSGFRVESATGIMHFPRLLGRLLARAVPRAQLLRAMLAFERLGTAPTRYLTAQFVAVAARRD